MVAGGCGDDAPPTFLGRKAGDLIRGSANLKGADRLHILQLEVDLAAIARAHPGIIE
jgi:hypothetical protein